MILLPREIAALRPKRRQRNPVDREEFNIYYRNIIHPWREENSVQALCDYGGDMGNGWRLSEYPDDVDAFPLTLRVRDCWGNIVESAQTTVHLYDRRSEMPTVRVMMLGDSMTHSGLYVEQVAQKLRGIEFCGSRVMNGIAREGRGGWTARRYLEQSAAYDRGVSPFLFPRGVSGPEYYGDFNFWMEGATDPQADPYRYDGFHCAVISPGQVCLRDGALWRAVADGRLERLERSPEFAFSFRKYRERFGVPKPDIVSLLFGANEMQRVEPEDAPERIEQTVAVFEELMRGIREDCPQVRFVLNLPVIGAQQYAWGMRIGCHWTAAQYDLNIKRFGEALLARWDGQESAGVYISPMLLCIDPMYGFDWAADRANLYSDALTPHHVNWVQPGKAGYQQMGDALAATIQRIRSDMAMRQE